MDKITFYATSIHFEKYALKTASVSETPKLPAENIAEIRLTRRPLEVITRQEEVLYIPACYKPHLDLFARSNQIPIVEKTDLWSLINEPFLDTTFPPDQQARTLDILANNGMPRENVLKLRRKISDKMLTYNATLWEWVHLGGYDTMLAHKFDRNDKNKDLYNDFNKISCLGSTITHSQPDTQEIARSKFLSLATQTKIPFNKAEEIFLNLASHYNEPHRRYHNLEHVLKVVEYCEFLSAEQGLENTTPLILAAWFHDIIYDPHLSANEQESANLMQQQLREYLSKKVLDQASDLIMLTTNHTSAKTTEEKILADADLSTLAETSRDYLHYTKSIRQEYAHIETPLFHQGRLHFLNTMLDHIRSRNRLFHFLHPLHETRAAENLQTERNALTAAL